MQKRIDNDFTVTLNITRKGAPEDFTTASGITVVLQHMTCSFIRFIPNQITVNGSKISFPVTADQQKEPGKYRVLVKYHKTALDGIKTYTVDKCDIFELVSDDCGIDTTDTDVLADIDVKIEQDGKDGLSAYELAVLNGYNGTLEEYEKALTDAPKLATQVSRLKRRSKSIRDSIIVVESLDRRVSYNANKGQYFAFSPGKPILIEALRATVSSGEDGFIHNSELVETDGIFRDGDLLNFSYINIKPIKLPFRGYKVNDIEMYANGKDGMGCCIFRSSLSSWATASYYDANMKPITNSANAFYFSLKTPATFNGWGVGRISIVVNYEGHPYNFSMFHNGRLLSDLHYQTFSIRNIPTVYINGNKCLSAKPLKPTLITNDGIINNFKEIRLRKRSSFHSKVLNFRYRKPGDITGGRITDQNYTYVERPRYIDSVDMWNLLKLVTAYPQEIISEIDGTPYSKFPSTDRTNIPRNYKLRKRLEKWVISSETAPYLLFFDFEFYNFFVVKGKRVYSDPLRIRLRVRYKKSGGRIAPLSENLTEL